MLFTVDAVHCVGACGLAPVMMIDDQVFGLLTPETAVTVIEALQSSAREESEGEVAR
jgi:NADH:ubiquinone oxidoreductase subunit E